MSAAHAGGSSRPPIRQSKLVRDLEWALSSPQMFDSRAVGVVESPWCSRIHVASEEWLRALDQDPSPLRDWLSQQHNRLRLGFYFGYLVEYWLRYCPAVGASDVCIGQQLRKPDGGTMGQLKYVFSSENGIAGSAALGQPGMGAMRLHWEASVKYFIHTTAEKSAVSPAAQPSIGNSESEGRIRELAQYVGPFLCENLAYRPNANLAYRNTALIFAVLSDTVHPGTGSLRHGES